jgi:hypothetical protein
VGQNAGEVTLRINPMPFGAGDEAVERGGTLGGDVMPREEPVVCVPSTPLDSGT